MVHTWVLAGAIMAAGWVQQGAAPAPVYDATFSVTTDNGTQAYTGTTTFVVDAKGGVTGKMNLTQPTGGRGHPVRDDQGRNLDVRVPYSIAAQNCTGTVKGTGTVPADRKAISGTATILGGCTSQPLSATFTFKLQEKKGE